ncbi:hypothetical protein GQR58_028039 [Nymphon striatum]|nr:hypothetical protein GQR58_028039 [Nymphon striatum]
MVRVSLSTVEKWGIDCVVHPNRQTRKRKSPLNGLGKFLGKVTSEKYVIEENIYVIDQCLPLLSRNACVKLNLVKLNVDKISAGEETFVDEFPQLFSGIVAKQELCNTAFLRFQSAHFLYVEHIDDPIVRNNLDSVLEDKAQENIVEDIFDLEVGDLPDFAGLKEPPVPSSFAEILEGRPDIHLPHKTKTRGRPKGTNQSVTGLPKKKANFSKKIKKTASSSMSSEIDPMVTVESLKAAPCHMNECTMYLQKADDVIGPEGDLLLPEDLHLYVGNNSLRTGDLKTLLPAEYLNDQVTHAFLETLSREVNVKIYVLPSFLAVKWEKGDIDSWLYEKVSLYLYTRVETESAMVTKVLARKGLNCKCSGIPVEDYLGNNTNYANKTTRFGPNGSLVAEIDFEEFTFIFLPICTNEHWILLAADMVNNSVGILDSLDWDKSRHALYLTSWQCFMRARGNSAEWSVIKYTSCKQEDRHSCGVFAMMNAEAIAKGVPPNVMRQLHCSTYRRYVLGKLLHHGQTNEAGNLRPEVEMPMVGIRWDESQLIEMLNEDRMVPNNHTKKCLLDIENNNEDHVLSIPFEIPLTFHEAKTIMGNTWLSDGVIIKIIDILMKQNNKVFISYLCNVSDVTALGTNARLTISDIKTFIFVLNVAFNGVDTELGNLDITQVFTDKNSYLYIPIKRLKDIVRSVRPLLPALDRRQLAVTLRHSFPKSLRMDHMPSILLGYFLNKYYDLKIKYETVPFVSTYPVQCKVHETEMTEHLYESYYNCINDIVKPPLIILSSSSSSSSNDSLKDSNLDYIDLMGSIEKNADSENVNSQTEMTLSMSQHLHEVLYDYLNDCGNFEKNASSENVNRKRTKIEEEQIACSEKFNRNVSITDNVQMVPNNHTKNFLLDIENNNENHVLSIPFEIPLTLHEAKTIMGNTWLSDGVIIKIIEILMKQNNKVFISYLCNVSDVLGTNARLTISDIKTFIFVLNVAFNGVDTELGNLDITQGILFQKSLRMDHIPSFLLGYFLNKYYDLKIKYETVPFASTYPVQ